MLQLHEYGGRKNKPNPPRPLNKSMSFNRVQHCKALNLFFFRCPFIEIASMCPYSRNCVARKLHQLPVQLKSSEKACLYKKGILINVTFYSVKQVAASKLT